MIIRPYNPEDYKEVVNLLIKCNVEPPIEATDLKGLCIVAEEKEQIVGCIWALTGLSSQAHLDYTAIHPDFQRTQLGWNLLKAMDKTLLMNGIHRYTFHVEPDNKRFLDLFEKYGMQNNTQQLRDLKFFRREIGD